MKVKFSFPVRGTLRLEPNSPIEFDDFTFFFDISEETGYVNRIAMEVRNVSRELWPTLVQVERDPTAEIPTFPFRPNEEALRFQQFEQELVNLESYLSMFGLEAIRFDMFSEEWIADLDDEQVGMFAGMSVLDISPAELGVPVTPDTLARCIVAANAPEQEIRYLAFFRVAQVNFVNGLFIECIKFCYLCLEDLFANGKSKKNATLGEFQRSRELKGAIEYLFFKIDNRHYNELLKKRPDLRPRDTESFLRFIVDLRGRLQHANPSSSRSWHPSRQHAFREEGECLFQLVESICYTRVMKRLQSIPTSKDRHRVDP